MTRIHSGVSGYPGSTKTLRTSARIGRGVTDHFDSQEKKYV